MLTFSFVFFCQCQASSFEVLIEKELVTMEEVSIFLARKAISSMWVKQTENFKSTNLIRVGMSREC